MSFRSPLRHPRFWKALSSPPGGGRGLPSSARSCLSVPWNAFLRFCSPRCHCPSSLLRRAGVRPCLAGGLPLGPRGWQTGKRENAGFWHRGPTGLLRGPRQSCGGITLPPCLRASRSRGSMAVCSAGQRDPLELRRPVSIHIPAEQPF